MLFFNIYILAKTSAEYFRNDLIRKSVCITEVHCGGIYFFKLRMTLRRACKISDGAVRKCILAFLCKPQSSANLRKTLFRYKAHNVYASFAVAIAFFINEEICPVAFKPQSLGIFRRDRIGEYRTICAALTRKCEDEPQKLVSEPEFIRNGNLYPCETQVCIKGFFSVLAD